MYRLFDVSLFSHFHSKLKIVTFSFDVESPILQWDEFAQFTLRASLRARKKYFVQIIFIFTSRSSPWRLIFKLKLQVFPTKLFLAEAQTGNFRNYCFLCLEILLIADFLRNKNLLASVFYYYLCFNL